MKGLAVMPQRQPTHHAGRRSWPGVFKGLGAALALSVVAALPGCGGSPQQPVDSVYNADMSAGTTVFDIGHAAQAVLKYQEAYNRAIVADNAPLLYAAAVNLATAQLASDDLPAVRQTLAMATTALKLRNWRFMGRLRLIGAAVALRQQNWQSALEQARAAAGEATAAQAATTSTTLQEGERATQQMAVAFEGLAANGLGDRALLAASLESLSRDGALAAPGLLAELQADMALMNGQPAQALQAAGQAVAAYRQGGDFRSMRRALLVEATAAQRSQPAQLGLASQLRAQAAASATAEQAANSVLNGTRAPS
ncbi:hypothetical protein E3E12_00220 [Formicincola oecophyllae]|uniref:Tetratricopeptide repeat protein n=1 Tax=Formicincola oecophyllae TaxID=2558361 RepID=A0A4Y6U6B8_9PROT|nr:hypothetical protein [Formicincola oecophyllae]QDH12889.1 hypothetical protein E3E12_00220 [Formicincola oecophyllae]